MADNDAAEILARVEQGLGMLDDQDRPGTVALDDLRWLVRRVKELEVIARVTDPARAYQDGYIDAMRRAGRSAHDMANEEIAHFRDDPRRNPYARREAP